ncbi:MULTISPECIES: hypothetical protein [unclassified Paracoccus (in: a-proteobacteria)]|uniref:hypothetical protein n=1 Tax=unclassified Paracoccus (in: a-proteobacteria) TaxID=2688777 RepID=UPI002551AE9D|nr:MULTISPECIES: hypothetical protein [unclassified Paracoccus (in: a-proteobacteria)]MDK8875236.1 hypothetical protein [Paracoccus sp. SSJ]
MPAGPKGKVSALAGRWLLALWLCALLSACADRQSAVEAATALAEAAYPGRLELVGTHLQKDHYDVVFAIRGDPFTRIRFGVDRDASRCRPASPCEDRLHRAYAAGVSAGVKLRALNAAFPRCGVVPLAVQDAQAGTGFTTVVELDLAVQDQQPALDRLTPCIAAFRSALPPDATPEQRSLKLRILLPKPGETARPPVLLTFETTLARTRNDDISFLIGAGPETDRISAGNLRVHPAFLSAKTIRNQLVDAAAGALSADPAGGHVPKLAFATGARLDPQRLDVIRSYILACSTARKGQGPCKTDIAVRLRHDLGTGEVIPEAILRDIRDSSGSLHLPPLPGRGVG